jgi:hypothetical protein
MLSLALLAGAGLLIESVSRLAQVPLGFRTDHILTFQIELPKWSYSRAEQRVRFYREILDRAATLPGLESAALASSLPLNNSRFGGSTLLLEGKPRPDSAALRDIAQVSITPGYFHVMGVALERGRFFDDRDRARSEPVAIVSQALVRKYFPDENPIGKRIKVGESANSGPWLTIVGISAEEKRSELFSSNDLGRHTHGLSPN